MFRISSIDLTGRRALIVDADDGLVDQMAAALREAGASHAGRFTSTRTVLAFIRQYPASYCVLMHVDQADVPGRPLIDIFRDLGAELVFVAGYDDWFDVDNDVFDEMSIAS